MKKKLIGIILSLIMASSFAMPVFAGSKVTLDISSYKKNAASVLSEERQAGGGAMKWHIPSGWAQVETPLENADGYAYRLNTIPSQMRTDAEQFYIFYFKNEKYLLNRTDSDNREGIEKAVIKNILPGTTFPVMNMSIMGFPTARIGKNGFLTYPEYDYYATNYKDKNGKIHNAEFVFLPNGTKGMCCALYVFTESVHRDEIVGVLRDISVK